MPKRILNNPPKLAIALFSFMAIGACDSAGDDVAAIEKANKEKAIYCMELLEKRPTVEKVEKFGRECLGETYIQHAPHIPDGRDAFLERFKSIAENVSEMDIDIKRAAADGDLVWLHANVKPRPDVLGSAGIHIFRMEDGKFVEHWGVTMPVPAEAQNDNTMF